MKRDWAKIHDYVRRLNVAPGGRFRGECPSCGSLNTFSVTRNVEGTWFKCFSARCDIGGKSDSLASVDSLIAASKELKKKAREEFPPLNVENNFVLSSRATAWLLQHPGVYRHFEAICDVPPLWDHSSSSIFFPIRHRGRIVDGTSRSTAVKHWKKLSNTGLPFVTQRSGTALIVEDPVSAYFRPDIFSGVSLNGTKLTAQAKAFIAKNYQRAIIALDKDVSPGVIMKMQRDLGQYIPTISVRIYKDLKWYTADESEKFISGVKHWINGGLNVEA